MTTLSPKEQEIRELRDRLHELEAEREQPQVQWQAKGFYTAYYATTGFLLGGLAAMSSLLVNIVGAVAVGKHPLELIRVYLTFPMGAQALDYDAVDNGMILAVGCCLYLATGMLYGIVFQIVLVRLTEGSTLAYRFVVVSLLSLAVWLVNFYGVLSWLQPLLFGGRWIVDLIPWWVAAVTHLVFGWTMMLVYPLGRYRPYRLENVQ